MSLVDTREQILPKKDPLERPDYTEADVHAVRALQRGEATPDQQIRALEWMILAFGTHDTSFRPGDPYLTAFAEGRRSAGTTLVWMLKSAPSRTDPDKIATRKIGNE